SLLPTARFLHESGRAVLVHFARPYPGWEADVALARENGFQAADAAGRDVTAQIQPLTKAEKNLTRLSARSFFRAGLKLRAYAAHVRAFITRTRPAAILLPEENLEYLSHVLTREATRLGVPSLVLPYTLDNPLEACEAYHCHPRHRVSGTLRQWFAKKHPQWAREHRGVTLLRIPFPAALAMQQFGFAPPDPWQNTCSFATRVLLESDAARRAYASSGIPDEKFAIIGSTVHDRMAAILSREAENRAELLHELGLDPKRPVFLAAIPPDQFNTKRAGCEFASHAEIVTFWLETLSATGWNVIVNLHPHLKPEEIDFGAWPNVKYSARPTAEVIPLCDVFVASISATIRWAVACGKTVINHDLYLYRYDDYTGAPGVIHLETKAAFTAEVARVATQPPASTPHSDWGILDGKSGERLKNLL
ncbi:MAG: hypothetical protein JNG86_04635, partial [Verrucomicrobiaceae bacterium]|nr:hypothetical protein [Verrucomicrobiaceae bacterium]